MLKSCYLLLFIFGMTLSFSFDPKRYRRLRSNIPRIQFTCAELAQTELPPYLRQCYKFLEYLEKRDNEYSLELFAEPENMQEYCKIVKKPMFFSIIKENVLNSKYKTLDEFKSDVNLIWSNYALFYKEDPEKISFVNRLKDKFNRLWQLHTGIKNPDVTRKSLEMLKESKTMLGELKKEVETTFPFPKNQEISDQTKSKKRKIVRSGNTEDASKIVVPEDKLKKPMTTTEMYKLANKVDSMPIELLGGVIDILSTHPKFNDKEDVLIPLSEIDNEVLRRIEAYVNNQSDKENNVRKMYQDDKINVDDQIKSIEDELNKVKEKIKAKDTGDESSAASEASEAATDSSYDSESDEQD